MQAALFPPKSLAELRRKFSSFNWQVIIHFPKFDPLRKSIISHTQKEKPSVSACLSAVSWFNATLQQLVGPISRFIFGISPAESHN